MAPGAEEVQATPVAPLVCLLLAVPQLDTVVSGVMRGRTGAVVVLDAHSGSVIAQHNAAVASRTLARPGSVMKPFTLAALLGSSAFRPGQALACPHTVRIGARKLDCSHPQSGAPLDAVAALAYSCNHYFSNAARSLKPEELLGVLNGVGRASLATDAEQLALQAIGEANIQVTPRGLAAAYRSLALRIAREPRLRPVLEGMEGCVRYGTGQLAAMPGLAIAGKTGTGTTGPGGYSHGWFAGFAPADKPEVVVVVFLERGQGGADAAPLAREVFRAWQASRSEATATVRYRVRLHWVSRRDGETISLPPEEYVAAVLAGEATVLRSDEALKAMAVAARTYAHRFAGRHAAEGFDFCDTTHCQDLRLSAVTERVRQAASATGGEMAWHQGRPVAAYYHADCGGSTEADSDELYLLRVRDPDCGASTWTASIAKRDLVRALRSAGFRSAAENAPFSVIKRTPSGRAASIQLGGLAVPAGALHTAIGQTLGWNLLRSTLYSARDQGSAVAFRGSGAGHGIGLCQRGADALGARGKTYREILAHYYPGTVVGRGARDFQWTRLGGERVDLWTTQPSADRTLAAAADRAVSEAERRSGIAIPGRAQFRVYPSVAAFRDATGEAGNVAAFARGAVIHLQPAQVLRGAGTLDRTLLHEALHIALESRARPGLPLWFREGLAAYLTDRNPRTRVGRLATERGLGAMLGWLRDGLPPDLGEPADQGHE
ncbi:MAG TPA: SpoIID/LytB domain-containing protein [Bryobacteraceae bacterium]|nr:SpoIID/LytB domain-containing protein [Bryobacteraceae bacterium]